MLSQSTYSDFYVNLIIYPMNKYLRYHLDSRVSSFYQYIQFVEFVKLQRTKSESNILKIYKELISKEITELFPNMCIIIRIYLTLMISNATGERIFSKLKLIKTYLRNSLDQDKLSNLALLFIENNIVKSLNTTEITNIFVNMKTRKKL